VPFISCPGDTCEALVPPLLTPPLANTLEDDATSSPTTTAQDRNFVIYSFSLFIDRERPCLTDGSNNASGFARTKTGARNRSKICWLMPKNHKELLLIAHYRNHDFIFKVGAIDQHAANTGVRILAKVIF